MGVPDYIWKERARILKMSYLDDHPITCGSDRMKWKPGRAWIAPKVSSRDSIFQRNQQMGSGGKFFLGCLLCIPFLGLMGYEVYAGYACNRDVTGYLKRAADSNTVEMAKSQLNTALVAIERNGWTSGSTHVFFNTPHKDVGFWYQNLKASYDELGKLTPQTTQLESTNVLMKLRETILDHGSEGKQVVTVPPGLSIHPYNGICLLLFWVTLVFGAVGCVLVVDAVNG